MERNGDEEFGKRVARWSSKNVEAGGRVNGEIWEREKGEDPFCVAGNSVVPKASMATDSSRNEAPDAFKLGKVLAAQGTSPNEEVRRPVGGEEIVKGADPPLSTPFFFFFLFLPTFSALY